MIYSYTAIGPCVLLCACESEDSLSMECVYVNRKQNEWYDMRKYLPNKWWTDITNKLFDVTL